RISIDSNSWDRSLRRLHGTGLYRDYFYRSFGTGGEPMLPPGKSILVAPIATMNDLAHHRYVPDTNASPKLRESVKQEQAFRVADSTMQASLDLAVSAEGRKAGPDEANALIKLRDQAAGHMAIIQEMAARLKASHSDLELKQWLGGHTQRRVLKD